jgi:hypothetical protein
MLSGLWRLRGDDSAEMPQPARSQRRARLRGGLILAGLAGLTAVPTALDVDRHRELGAVAVGFAAIGTLLIALVPQIMANSDWSACHLRGERNHLLDHRVAHHRRDSDQQGLLQLTTRQVQPRLP